MKNNVLFTTTKKELIAEVAEHIGKKTTDTVKTGRSKKYLITEDQFNLVVTDLVQDAVNDDSDVLI
jgi:hypothetical protein